VYATAKELGKYMSIPRTEGVSTTDILGRMLLLTKQHHCHNQEIEESSALESEHSSSERREREFVGPQSKFLTTSRMLQLFSAGVKAPTKDMRVIYVDGAWDLFHPGHVAFLQEARKVSLVHLGILPAIVAALSHIFVFILCCNYREVTTCSLESTATRLSIGCMVETYQ
jgi:glycerol-3-phosphate cytidylyltransferase-like family protein